MELPLEAPVMTLPNVILFPHAMLPLFIFEPKYRKMLEDSLNSHRMFCIAMQQPGKSREVPSGVAGLGLIRACVAKKDGTSNLILQGLSRVRLVKVRKYKPYRVHQIEPLESSGSDTLAVDALTARLLELLGERLEYGFTPELHILKKVVDAGAANESVAEPVSIKDSLQYLANMNEPEHLVDLISCSLLPSPYERQTILETLNLERRLKFLIHFLLGEIKRLKKKK